MGSERVVREIVSNPPGYNFVHGPEVLLRKHTGYAVTIDEMAETGMGRDLLRMIHDLTGMEYRLQIARNEMLRLAEKIRQNIESDSDRECEPFFEGEVAGSKISTIDDLLKERSGKIATIQALINRMLGEHPKWAEDVIARTNPGQAPGQAAA